MVKQKDKVFKLKGETIKKVEKNVEPPDRRNYTFRMKIELMDRFKVACEEKELSMAKVLEALINDSLEEK
jgi:hypothetical protein